jgi:glycogen operon protein
MTDDEWEGPGRSVALFLNGEGVHTRGAMGERIVDDSFLVLFHDDPAPVSFVLPPDAWGKQWQRLLDTRNTAPDRDDGPVSAAGESVTVDGRAVVLLRRSG